MGQEYEFGDTRIPARFWEKVDVSEDGCWYWTAAKFPAGYGRFCMGSNTHVSAHRFAFKTLVGFEVPELDHICHDPALCNKGSLCPHRSCVNPAHLRPSSHRDNALRSNSPQAINAAKTHCPQGHPYEGENLALLRRPDGSVRRQCRACKSEWDRNFKLRNPELVRQRAVEATRRYRAKKRAAT